MPFGIPQPRLGNTFGTFSLKRAPGMRAALERCGKVANEVEWCAFLLGGPGNGKTHLAIAALLAHQPLGGGAFWKAADLLAFLRRKLSEGIEAGWGQDEVEQIIANYSSPSFLFVLDDLGTENKTEWAAEQLYRLLDARYEACAPTIITSNAGLEAIDVRLRSRYREGLVVCEGKDLR